MRLTSGTKESQTAMTQTMETASNRSQTPGDTGEPPQIETPTDPASLWASVGAVHYSVTHTGEHDSLSWIDCDCVVHID